MYPECSLYKVIKGHLYLDLHGAGGKSGDFLLHAISNTRVHRCPTRKDVISVKVFTDINVALHDAVVGRLMDTSRLHTCKIHKWNRPILEVSPVLVFVYKTFS